MRQALTFFLDEKSKKKNQDDFELADRSNKKSSSVHMANAIPSLVQGQVTLATPASGHVLQSLYLLNGNSIKSSFEGGRVILIMHMKPQL
ncbi:hypothetical protein [Pontibacter sp. HSC-36F09]|uniref:hypothetical protein n=1 Tax=Pontibacter sp. HSC-36F09 TaxID=2910966 RepID=UPI0020A003D7|nr:hypothetical protein [Pontibacter sp. HSC-36F09]MCP2045139.1 sRNA-binding regulator protein Hfq [Pontibacter sp. HSC-36F09]